MLLIQEKDIRRSEWTRILSRSFATESFSSRDLSGEIALIRIDKTKSPLCVTTNGRQYKIVDDGFRWLQIAPKDANWWLTAMFDEKDTLLQMYFDITAGNLFDDAKNPKFRDMYLDLVLRPDGVVVLLDEDELTEALENGAITQTEFEQTKAAAEKLRAHLSHHPQEVMDRCRQTHHSLKSALEERR